MNQRREFRLTGNHTVVIQVVTDSQHEFLLTCSSVDISSEGLQVTVNTALEAGNIYFVTLIPDEDDLAPVIAQEKFHLVAEIIWCNEINASGTYRTGLHFLNSEDEHYLAWKHWVLHKLQQLQEDE